MGPGGRASQISKSLNRQSKILDKHEKTIAKHTAIQTAISWLSLVMGIVTTSALIGIAYFQFRAQERQVELEYAKVSPSFLVEISAYRLQDEVKFPTALKVRLLRGEARVKAIHVHQDLIIAAIIDGRDEHLNCIARIDNYFSVDPNSLATSTHATVTSVARDPYRRFGKEHFMTVRPGATWVEIEFDDLFGKARQILYGNPPSGTPELQIRALNSDIRQIPNGKRSAEYLSEVVDASFRDAKEITYPRLWNPVTGLKDPECRELLFDLQR
jgi:hypothetical protein